MSKREDTIYDRGIYRGIDPKLHGQACTVILTAAGQLLARFEDAPSLAVDSHWVHCFIQHERD